ncbi:putative endonuclease [Silvimonas terrae]|uniref:UPF0102 protein HNQ50_001923 n=1 Tax=Silvimonas terrae TaxID=300266 RepID=A0A840RFL8_9NEIS|nr:YraN family protein [Silvimonas terrae]MBB5191200.1 putative endonuclease [Silvimonas terrae]
MKQQGDAAEARAADYLAARGLTLLARNWHCRFGEIDLIAQEGETLVFVEVRQRRNTRFGGAAFSITPAKQARLLATSTLYLAQLQPQPPCRFDAIIIEGNQLHWLKNCIDASDGY